jgi:hypothetical protein
MNVLVALGHGPPPEFSLLVLALLIGLPVLALFLGFRKQSYADAFFFAGVLSLPWIGLVALVGQSVLYIVFGGIGTPPSAKHLFSDFVFVASIFLLAAVGQWLRVRKERMQKETP